MRTLHIGQLRLAYADTGGGRPALLLVHGWGSDARSWDTHLPRLVPRHRVVTVDLRGHGLSSAPDSGYDPPTIAGDLVALLDHLAIERVVGVGHSWGGQLVTTLAVEHPDRVAAVVALDPAYGAVDEDALRIQSRTWRSTSALDGLLRFAEGAFTPDTPAPVRAMVCDGFRRTSPHALAEAFDAMYLTDGAYGLRPATEAYLRRVRQPMLAVYSDGARARWARGLIAPPRSRVVAWPGAGHYLHQEQPEATVALLEEWLAPGAPLLG